MKQRSLTLGALQPWLELTEAKQERQTSQEAVRPFRKCELAGDNRALGMKTEQALLEGFKRLSGAKERTSLTSSRSAEGLDGKRSPFFTVVLRLTVDGVVLLSCFLTRVEG